MNSSIISMNSNIKPLIHSDDKTKLLMTYNYRVGTLD